MADRYFYLKMRMRGARVPPDLAKRTIDIMVRRDRGETITSVATRFGISNTRVMQIESQGRRRNHAEEV
jgi:hypothetical protein